MSAPECTEVVSVEEFLTSRYEAVEDLAVIRELTGYEGTPEARTPIWGDRIGVYQAMTADIIQLDDEDWRVLDTISAGTVPETVAVVPAEEKERMLEIASALAERFVIVPRGEMIRIPYETSITRHEVYVGLTEACNYNCKGCVFGVDQMKPGFARTMDLKTLNTLLESAVVSSAERGMDTVHFKWAGGEPTMPLPFKRIMQAQEKIKELREQYPSIDITQVIISNGVYLDEATVESIKGMDKDMLVSVSLWGLGETHDRIRGAKTERDRFPNVVRGIQRLHEAGIAYNVHYVITPENAAESGQFMEAVWDTESENFLGRDWDWPDGKRPLPVTISFFRPQDEEQLVALNQGGHQAMVDGTKRGFEVIRDLIERGEAVPAVDRIDYLQLNRVIPMVCGTGFNYTAASPRGVAPCHELLFGHEPNMDAVRDGRNLMDLANQPYAGQRKQLIGPNIANPGVDKTMALILALHGGTGCPITARLENGGNLGTAASTARELYPPLIPEMLALEAMRQNARQRQVAALN